MSYAAQAGRQSVASNQATQPARLLILGQSPRIALPEQEFNLGKLLSREGLRKEGQQKKKDNTTTTSTNTTPRKINTGQASRTSPSRQAVT